MLKTNRFKPDGDNARKLINQLHEFNPWAEILVEYIKRAGFKQKQLAAKINVAPAAVNLWCRGKRLPDGEKVELLVEALELSDDQADLFVDIWREAQIIRDLIPMLESAAKRENSAIFEKLYFELASALSTLKIRVILIVKTRKSRLDDALISYKSHKNFVN